jgi:hypothetical protein
MKTHEPIDHMAKAASSTLQVLVRKDAKVVLAWEKTYFRRRREELSSLCSRYVSGLQRYATPKRCMFDNLKQVFAS